MNPLAHKILVVDDDESLLRATVKMLKTEIEEDIVPIHSGADAIRCLNEESFAILLCDMEMPDVNGVAVLAEARKRQPHIVSILMTATTDRACVIESINQGGIWKFLAKPFRYAELLALVKEGLQRYAEQPAVSAKAPARKPAGSDAPPRPFESTPESLTEHSSEKRKIMIGKMKSHGPTLIDKRYRLLSVINEGGSGILHKADDLLLGMPVAIKALSARFLKNHDALDLLRHEARIAMQLSHKHIVRLHNLMESTGFFYLVMEYIDGSTLGHYIRQRGALPLNSVLQIASVTADALSYAHRHHVLHRDLKPDNMMLAHDGMLKLIDFGLSSLSQTGRDTGIICGTPGYMSPEEVERKSLDPRTDQFSMAVTLHTLLTGHIPANDSMDIKKELTIYAPVLSDTLPAPLRTIFTKALARKPDDRWPDVMAFSDALRHAAKS